ncbi:hypothetical protein P7C70_g8671, partial [Phenoliferia sp. Uapishka_3]
MPVIQQDSSHLPTDFAERRRVEGVPSDADVEILHRALLHFIKRSSNLELSLSSSSTSLFITDYVKTFTFLVNAIRKYGAGVDATKERQYFYIGLPPSPYRNMREKMGGVIVGRSVEVMTETLLGIAAVVGRGRREVAKASAGEGQGKRKEGSEERGQKESKA